MYDSHLCSDSVGWKRLARRSSHKARLTELNTSDDEIAERPSRSRVAEPITSDGTCSMDVCPARKQSFDPTTTRCCANVDFIQTVQG